MKTKILIVDDVEINRDILEEILEDKYDIFKASDGMEALKIIDNMKEELALILLDLMMPVLDGFGVMEGMKARKLLNRLPVIAISSDASETV